MIKPAKAKFRKPVARKATRPLSTKKGKRGYDRKREKTGSKRINTEQDND